MKIGILQRRFQVERPEFYDKNTRIVCLDIREETQNIAENEETVSVDGYSFIPVEIDNLIDYGHIKSQLIEAGFAQKDEFGLVMNAVKGIVDAISSADSFEEMKSMISSDDIDEFVEFCAFRDLCAAAAHLVVSYYE